VRLVAAQRMRFQQLIQQFLAGTHQIFASDPLMKLQGIVT
jgi:hypothetical protein